MWLTPAPRNAYNSRPAGAARFHLPAPDASDAPPAARPREIPDGAFGLYRRHFLFTTALATPYLVASLVILYFDRRVRTEAVDVQLAADALASGQPPSHLERHPPCR